MSLSYRHITDDQDKMRNLLEKGEYYFIVKDIEEKLCKNKVNKMLVVHLEVTNKEGRINLLTDWIMLDFEGMEWKFRHFASTCGLIDLYDNKTIKSVDFLGKEGIAKISISDYEKNGEYLKCNKVADYVKQNCTKSKIEPIVAQKTFESEEIPF